MVVVDPKSNVTFGQCSRNPPFSVFIIEIGGFPRVLTRNITSWITNHSLPQNLEVADKGQTNPFLNMCV